MEESTKYSKYKMGPTASVAHNPNRRYAPSTENWRKAQNICDILECFQKCKESMHNLPSPAGLFDKLWNVKEQVHRKTDMFKQPHYREDIALSMMRWKMENKFSECWKVCFFHSCMPMVMDPKYHLECIKSHIQYFTVETHYSLDTDIDDYIHNVHDTLVSLFNEYSNQVEGPNCSSGSKSSKKTVMNGDMLVEYYLHVEFPYGPRPLSELDQYLQEPHLTAGDSSVLQWWKEHNLTYPTIGRIARDILALPCSIDCTVATRTARIAMAEGSGYCIEELVCTQDWLKPAGSKTVASTDDL
ncbi:hypothetical protein ACP70R_006480 [Stipagrostis hirtigluma subsp. patula]